MRVTNTSLFRPFVIKFERGKATTPNLQRSFALIERAHYDDLAAGAIKMPMVQAMVNISWEQTMQRGADRLDVKLFMRPDMRISRMPHGIFPDLCPQSIIDDGAIVGQMEFSHFEFLPGFQFGIELDIPGRRHPSFNLFAFKPNGKELMVHPTVATKIVPRVWPLFQQNPLLNAILKSLIK